MMNDIEKFINDQLSVWPMAAANFRALKNVETREMNVGGLQVRLQHNPARRASSTAEIDPETLASRPCFLCVANRPAEQFHLKFEGRKDRKYNIQINPYPIFPGHLVIAREEHIPQAIWHHLPDMLDFAGTYRDYTVYYNGPVAGASAPDHLHFQACPRHLLPLENAVDAFLDNPGSPLNSVEDATLYHFPQFTRGVYCLKASTSKSLTKLFYLLLDCCDIEEGATEPRFNLYAYVKDGEYRVFVTIRRELRSHHYFSKGEDHMTISPGAAEMAGVFITPDARDMEKVTPEMLAEILDEVSISAEAEKKICWRLTRTEPQLEVGIMSAEEIVFEIISDGAGPQKVSCENGKVNYNGALYDELTFDAVTRSTMFDRPSFILHDVVIGVDFHWQRKVTQKFAGSLRFIVENGKVTAINRIGVENYLLSVISSEMKASATIEYLKAHSVISRSWVMSHIGHRACGETNAENEIHRTAADGTPVYIKWWDHDDHSNFDVCADDHCQRYQGLTMAVGANVRRAIDETWGQVLMSGDDICDARFSKCCGGTMELFSTCWEDRDYPYLRALPDAPQDGGTDFCNTSDKAVLAQVLNDYDLETQHFYRWEKRYSRDELSELVRRRSGIAFGTITDLIPIERGPSYRLKLLKVVGDKKTLIIGKELVIRRWLSESHLYSSAFDVNWEGDTVVLTGRGWGHGVGFCQIGAAVMAYRNYNYKQILEHYYPGSTLKQYD
ncbi:MAG: DUF4922 domain-containing protein [Bacteroidales bacterium]|nr:DUF4922 domain-containing protein [Bacteroidales bacterium]